MENLAIKLHKLLTHFRVLTNFILNISMLPSTILQFFEPFEPFSFVRLSILTVSHTSGEERYLNKYLTR